MELPDSIGQWYGIAQKPSKAELEQLAADTSFARRVYTNAFGDSIMASIVLAGEDPDNSLHRPERCLPAQGWTILDSKVVTIDDPDLPNNSLEVTRLQNQQKIQDEKGNIQTIYNLNYYWFVGYTPDAISDRSSGYRYSGSPNEGLQSAMGLRHSCVNGNAGNYGIRSVRS